MFEVMAIENVMEFGNVVVVERMIVIMSVVIHREIHVLIGR